MPLWFALLIPLLLAACSDGPVATETPPPPVKLVAANGGETAIRHFPGRVVAAEGSQLAFRVSGQLVALPVRSGEQVSQGQLLARLDEADFRNQLNDREAQFELADSNYQRSQGLHERGVISDAQFDELRARRRQAQAALQQSRDNLRYTRLQAPFDGTVARTLVDTHQFVQAQEPILLLQSNDNIDIEFSVPERFIRNIREDGSDYQPEIRFAGISDRVFRASYKEHEASADPRTQTYSITLTMPNPEGIFVLPGMSVSVAVDTRQVMRDSLSHPLVPVEAVFTRDGEEGSFVWRYLPDQQAVQLTRVTLGEIQGNGIQLLAGIDSGDQVVVAGVHALEDGQSVRPLEKERGL